MTLVIGIKIGNINLMSKIARGTSIGIFGAMSGVLLQLVSGMILVRLISKTEYGTYTIAVVIVSIMATLSNLGFANGGSQLISKYLSEQNYSKVWGIVKSMLLIVAGVSSFLSVLLWFFTEKIAFVFNQPELNIIFPFFSITLVPAAISIALFTIYRGISRAWEKVFFDELLSRMIRLTGLVLVLVIGWKLYGVLWVTAGTTLFVFVVLCIYSYLSIPKYIPLARSIWGGRELFLFSLPLFGNNILEILMNSSSTLLLGYFNTAEQVGYYNVANTLSRLIQIPLTALAFIYLPIATAIQAGVNRQEVEGLYLSSTKWISVISLPILIVILLDAEFIVALLFGETYLPSCDGLRILAIGYFFHAAVGPNGLTLLAFGFRRAIFASSVLSAMISIGLSVILMPTLGAKGAALAVGCAFFISNMFVSMSLYRKCKIHPIKYNYCKSLFFMALFSALCWLYLSNYPLTEIWQHFVLIVFIVVNCLAAPIITRSLDLRDLVTLRAIETKFTSKTNLTAKVAIWCGITAIELAE